MLESSPSTATATTKPVSCAIFSQSDPFSLSNPTHVLSHTADKAHHPRNTATTIGPTLIHTHITATDFNMCTTAPTHFSDHELNYCSNGNFDYNGFLYQQTAGQDLIALPKPAVEDTVTEEVLSFFAVLNTPHTGYFGADVLIHSASLCPSPQESILPEMSLPSTLPATPEAFEYNIDPALLGNTGAFAIPTDRLVWTAPKSDLDSVSELFTAAMAQGFTIPSGYPFQQPPTTSASPDLWGQTWAMSAQVVQNAEIELNFSDQYHTLGSICGHTSEHMPATPPLPCLARPSSSSSGSVSPRSAFSPESYPIRPVTNRTALTKPVPRFKPYTRPVNELVKLSAKIDARDFTNEELERIRSRSQHKQLKEAKIIQAENEGKHITVPAEFACEGCASLGYHCMVPRLEDFGHEQVEHHLGFCAGCISNRGECTFRKRPERRIAAYQAAYGDQEGFELFGSKGHGVKIMKAKISEFTKANTLKCWQYGGYP